jgi:hypothetical protein
VREIFDRVGIEQRAAGAFDVGSMSPAEFVDIGGDSIYPPLLATTSIVVVGERIPVSYFQQDFAIDDPFADIALAGYGYHFVRDVLEFEVVAERGFRHYLNEPNVTAVTVRLSEIDSQAGAVTTGIDLVHRSFGSIPIEGTTGSTHPQVLAGVFSHVAERSTVEGTAGRLDQFPPMQFFSVGRVFEEARTQGIAVRLIEPGAAPTDFAISDRAKILIGEATGAGYAVIVPERPVALNGKSLTGWWQLDPRTGVIWDRMETGRGDQFFERLIMQIKTELKKGEFKRLGSCMYALITFVALGVLAVYATQGIFDRAPPWVRKGALVTGLLTSANIAKEGLACISLPSVSL